MERKFIRLFLALTIFGLGTYSFAFEEFENWTRRAIDARFKGDYPTAFQCFKRAAETGGGGEAEYNLGYCYQAGLGVIHSDEEAVKWFRKSAEHGSGQGIYSLGTCYENGWGLATDAAKAKECYQAAKQKGFNGAAEALKRLNGDSSIGNVGAGSPAASK